MKSRSDLPSAIVTTVIAVEAAGHVVTWIFGDAGPPLLPRDIVLALCVLGVVFVYRGK